MRYSALSVLSVVIFVPVLIAANSAPQVEPRSTSTKDTPVTEATGVSVARVMRQFTMTVSAAEKAFNTYCVESYKDVGITGPARDCAVIDWPTQTGDFQKTIAVEDGAHFYVLLETADGPDYNLFAQDFSITGDVDFRPSSAELIYERHFVVVGPDAVVRENDPWHFDMTIPYRDGSWARLEALKGRIVNKSSVLRTNGLPLGWTAALTALWNERRKTFIAGEGIQFTFPIETVAAGSNGFGGFNFTIDGVSPNDTVACLFLAHLNEPLTRLWYGYLSLGNVTGIEIANARNLPPATFTLYASDAPMQNCHPSSSALATSISGYQMNGGLGYRTLDGDPLYLLPHDLVFGFATPLFADSFDLLGFEPSANPNEVFLNYGLYGMQRGLGEGTSKAGTYRFEKLSTGDLIAEGNTCGGAVHFPNCNSGIRTSLAAGEYRISREVRQGGVLVKAATTFTVEPGATRRRLSSLRRFIVENTSDGAHVVLELAPEEIFAPYNTWPTATLRVKAPGQTAWQVVSLQPVADTSSGVMGDIFGDVTQDGWQLELIITNSHGDRFEERATNIRL